MTVRYLDQTLINQIAAGEVIERPASAIKELVENAIDAEATKIDVVIKDGGRTLLSVTDNGKGMGKADLELCVERHATSKIPDGDLFNIRTLGFRGEALPSIGSVSRMTLTSRPQDGSDAWQLLIEGGQKHAPQPTSAAPGTRIEVRDLFFATPARLKFLKSPTTELNHITDILYRQALANPQIAFTLRNEDKQILNFSKDGDRFTPILGKDFQQNAIPLEFQRGESRLTGWTSIPSYNRSNSTDQYLFVNGRPVKDKLFATALKVAYMDVLASNRFPAAVLFLTCDPEDVDINVHPAKAEVRFRDGNLMRGFIIAAIREALQGMATQSASTIGDKTIAAFTSEQSSYGVNHAPTSSLGGYGGYGRGGSSFSSSSNTSPGSSGSLPLLHRSQYTPLSDITPPFHHGSSKDTSWSSPAGSTAATIAQFDKPKNVSKEYSSQEHPLGYARAQVHETYIIAESAENLILVDQHAAHERLVYEILKKDLANGLIKRQSLLIPTVLELTLSQFQTLEGYLETLSQFGFTIESYANNSLIIREMPTLLSKCNLKQFFMDLASEIADRGTDTAIESTFHEILADKACKNSIRAGRKLSIEEMNALLRDIEITPFSSQCNHGRPTYIKLSKTDLEKLFERA